jgi:hypothetical protein
MSIHDSFRKHLQKFWPKRINLHGLVFSGSLHPMCMLELHRVPLQNLQNQRRFLWKKNEFVEEILLCIY